MKKMICILLCVILACSALSVTAFADGVSEYTVYVTIADGSGQIVVPDEPISIEDNGMPIYAALKNIHDRFYPGGAKEGFEATLSEQYGLSLEKLWGVKNGGSYGYYVNNKPAYSLDDILFNGDHLYAWIYRDTVKWTDTYCYFENNEHINEAVAGRAFTGRLCAIEFDENWMPVSVPVEGAMITDNGEDTGVITDENGCFTVTPDAKVHIYSARSDTMTITTPRMYVNASFPTVSVTISDDKGQLQAIWERITLYDTDEDGKFTISDALFIAHDRLYEGGAAAGYEVKHTEQYGTSLEKLWGVKNGGAFGYYVNDLPAYSLDDELNNGDTVYAWIYQDAKTWSDQYVYFDRPYTEIPLGEVYEVKLMTVTFDENWQPVAVPFEDAVITIDGEETSSVTDADGIGAISFTTPGEHTVSAISYSAVITPPVMVVNVAPILGDADRDGVVTVIDATTIQKYKASLIDEERIDLSVSDVDGDGVVSVMDATRIQKYKAKICELDGTPIVQ
ncbi:MAG: dockerin type I repeat-containing protein [Ruminococcus sp.]|nr:dockerin type I repeat-containing protein [Ruminococcus sp.]